MNDSQSRRKRRTYEKRVMARSYRAQAMGTDDLGFRYLVLSNGDIHYIGAVYDRKKYRQQLFNEDPTCKLCHKPIESINHCNLDHIIPRVRGGRTVKRNLQLAHIKCNWEKGEKIV